MTYDDIDNQRASPEKDRKNKKQNQVKAWWRWFEFAIQDFILITQSIHDYYRLET